jgi:hypothetical protein
VILVDGAYVTAIVFLWEDVHKYVRHQEILL